MVPPPDGAYQPAYVALEPSPRTRLRRSPGVLATPAELPRPGSAARPPVPGGAAGRRLPPARGRARAPLPLRRRRAPVPRDDEAVAYEDALRAAGDPVPHGRAAATTTTGRRWAGRSRRSSAIEDPHDPVALVGALRSPFFGVTDEVLLGLHTAGGDFCYLRPLAGRRGPGAGAGLDAPRRAPSRAERRGAGRGGRAAPGRYRGACRLRPRASGRGARRQPPEGPRHGAGAGSDGCAHLSRARPLASRPRRGSLRGGGVRGRRRRRGATHDDPQGQGPRVPGRRHPRPRTRGAVAGASGPGRPCVGAPRREPGAPGRRDDDHSRLGRCRGSGDPAGGCRGAPCALCGPHARGARARPSRAVAAGRQGLLSASRRASRHPDGRPHARRSRATGSRPRRVGRSRGDGRDPRSVARGSPSAHRARRRRRGRSAGRRRRARRPPHARRAPAPGGGRAGPRGAPCSWISAAPTTRPSS